jgi:hypothetical protein
MEHDPIGNDVRRRRRRTRVGPNAACAMCGERDVRSLTRRGKKVLCYECAAKEDRRSPDEDHHVAGRHNSDFTVKMPGNPHQILNTYQQGWPRETLMNPDKSPLLKAAALLRGFLDILRLIIERILGWVPEFLETLDAWLRQTLGSRWWEQFGAIY